MKTRTNITLAGLIGGIVVVVIVLVWAATWNANVASNGVDNAVTVPVADDRVDYLVSYRPVLQPKPAQDKRKGRDLVNTSSEEVGEYAKLFASQHLKAKGTPEVLLISNTTREQIAALGLGCLPDFSSIEQPPLVLVILRGEFDFRGSLPGSTFADAPTPGEDRYVAYVFDVWSAFPVAMYESPDGSRFKKALEGSTQPDSEHMEESGPPLCPTQIPASQKSLHYGEEAPGFTDLPPLPQDIRENALPTVPIIPSTGTPGLSLPIPTTNDFPVLATAIPD